MARCSAAAAIDAEIRRLKRGTSLVEYKRIPAFARDLSTLGAASEGQLADADPLRWKVARGVVNGIA